MAKEIAKAKASEKTNRLWQKLNEVIDAVNALQNITISPESAGTVQYAQGNIKIVLNTEQCDA
jgi:hypothetical protein